jgi:DNA polymerase-3 subunit delta'
MAFREVIGHRRLLQVIARALHRGTLPPSAILAGPAGVGKRRAALAIAQALNCPAASSADGFDVEACGVCPTCQRITRGVHPDVILVEPGDSGAIKVEQVRDVIERAGYRPFEGRRRVVIVEDAEALLPAAQNALLKTLEEPPPSTVFLLVTARPDGLLPTVRSRCPLLRFGPLTEDEIVGALVSGGKSERQARAVAAVADGSIGRALEAEAGELLEARDVAVHVLSRASASSDPRRRLELTKELLEKTGAGGASDRERLAVLLRAMSGVLRDVALEATGAGAAASGPTAETRADRRLDDYAGQRGLRAFATIDRALSALAGNASPKIVADWVVLQL